MAIPDIIEGIKTSDNFLVTCHVNPDGDASGAIIGMMGLLKMLGKKAIAATQDPIPERYHFLSHWQEVKTVDQARELGPFQTVVLLDVGSLKRIGTVHELMDTSMKIINIDHHISNDGFGDASWVDENANSTSEMLVDIFREMKLEIDPDLALALYTGIMTDTGRFRYGVNPARALATSAGLVQRGADSRMAAENVFYSSRFNALQTLGEVFCRMKQEAGGRVITSYLTLEEKDVDNEGFVDHMAGVHNTDVALLIRYVEENLFKVSLRSTGDVDVQLIAARYNGGGHKKASGCRISGTYEEVYDQLMDDIKKALV